MKTLKSVLLAAICTVGFAMASNALAEDWPACPSADQIDTTPLYADSFTKDYYDVGINDIPSDWAGNIILEAKSAGDAMKKVRNDLKSIGDPVETVYPDEDGPSYECYYNVKIKGVDLAFLLTTWGGDDAKAQLRKAVARHLAG